MPLFIAKDGKRFLNKYLYEKHKFKLFEDENIKYLDENTSTIKFIYIENQIKWEEFTEYLLFKYSEEDISTLGISKYKEYIKQNIIICDDQSPINLKTFKQYKEQLLNSIKNTQILIKKLNSIGI